MTVMMEGKVALVTGASAGIGRATSLAFGRDGAKVVVADVDVGGGEETVHMIREAGGEAIFAKTDVSKSPEVEALITKAVEIYGKLDYAVNNAGILGTIASTVECTEEDWDRMNDINLKGVWLCMKYEIAQMLKQGGGVIVNISSEAGLGGNAGVPAYTAAKHGVVGLTKTAALEYAKAGIRVNVVCPGPIRTPGSESLIAAYPEAEEHALQVCPMGRVGTPEEAAEPIVWLCSDGASYITGHALSVDGGIMAQ